MKYDPYSGKQIGFERTDRSGRWSPIHEPTQEAWWVAVLGGVFIGACLAITLYLGVICANS